MFGSVSINSIKSIQDDSSRSTIQFFKFIYHLADTRVFFIITMIAFNIVSRQTAFYLTFMISLNVAISIGLKLIFRDGRPFMESKQILPYICQLSYGNPCTESMIGTSFFVTMGLYTVEKLKKQDDELSDK